MMTKLSVNINKFATLRNARGGNNPNILKVAQDCERFGAQGITVHPRPDERHIRYQDVLDLSKTVQVELNIEGYPNQKYLDMLQKVRPAQATLVPDPPHVLTSNQGWDTIAHQDFLKKVVAKIQALGIRCSVFVAPEEKTIIAAAALGADRIELYTEHYVQHYVQHKNEMIQPYRTSAEKAKAFGIGVNAGHGLSLTNLAFLKKSIPWLSEVSIGHALICDALYFGLEKTIHMYLEQLK